MRRRGHRASNCTTVRLVSDQTDEMHEVLHVLLFVRFLYMMRCPHCLQRIGSRGLISLDEPQSTNIATSAAKPDKK